MRGRFVTLEGGEGAGKSTQARRLCAWLGARGVPAVATREPGGTPAAEEIRRLLVEGEPARWCGLSEALLHSAARREHVRRMIAPALATGRWVVCDRFIDSTMAYQGYVQGVGRERVALLCDWVAGEVPPDLTFVLDLDPVQGLERARARGEGADRYERMDADFHSRLRAAFLDIAARAPERCVVIDAAADVESVGAALCAALAERFGLS